MLTPTEFLQLTLKQYAVPGERCERVWVRGEGEEAVWSPKVRGSATVAVLFQEAGRGGGVVNIVPLFDVRFQSTG